MGYVSNPLQPANIFSSFRNRRKTLMIAVLVIIVAFLLAAGYVWEHRDITIRDSDKTYHIKVLGGNVEKAIGKVDLKLSKEDLIEPGLKTPLKEGMTINITRAFPVKLLVDGKSLDVMTPYSSISRLLQKQHIKLGEMDRVEPKLNQKLKRGSVIKIVRVVVKTETKQEEIAYNVEKRNDNNLQKGQTKVISEGQKGLAEVTLKVTYEDGKEIKREIAEKKVVSKPVNAIVAVGTTNFIIASRGETVRYAKAIRMYATAYTHTGNNTASGVYPHRGVVSVDTSVIPLGTRLYIPGYGYAVALDKGSAIRGNRIDLFFDSKNEAYGFRNRYLEVYILE